MKESPILSDTFHTRGYSFLNKRTLWFTQGKCEGLSFASHSGIFFDEILTVEALNKGVQFSDWFKTIKGKAPCEWFVFTRTKKSTTNELMKCKALLECSVGTKYSKSELVLCALDGLIGKFFNSEPIIFRKLGNLFPSKIICSKFVAQIYIELGWLPQSAKYWTPDDLYDYQISCSDWKVKNYSEGWYNG